MGVVSLVKALWNWLYLSELKGWTDIVHAGANSGKLKVMSMIFGWAWSEMAVAI